MKIRIKLVVEHKDGGETAISEEVACFGRGDLLPETLGLTLQEGKTLLYLPVVVSRNKDIVSVLWRTSCQQTKWASQVSYGLSGGRFGKCEVVSMARECHLRPAAAPMDCAGSGGVETDEVADRIQFKPLCQAVREFESYITTNEPLNDDLRDTFSHWYPGMATASAEEPPLAA